MNALTCAAVRRRLEAFHDRELPPAEHYAVDQHLEGCPRCADAARSLEELADLLREDAGRRALTPDGAAGMRAAVLGRARAEDAVSWPRVMRELFEDMHLVWAGLSATAATVVCAVMLLGMAYFAPPSRDDSLAGLMGAVAGPDGVVRPERAVADVVRASWSSGVTEEDLVMTLAEVVTQEGRVRRTHLPLSQRPDRETVLRIMNAVSASRFRPVTIGEAPRPSDLVWMAHWSGGGRIYGLTHTTVRGRTLI